MGATGAAELVFRDNGRSFARAEELLTRNVELGGIGTRLGLENLFVVDVLGIYNSGEEVNIVNLEENVPSADNKRDLVLGILKKQCQLREEIAGEKQNRDGQLGADSDVEGANSRSKLKSLASSGRNLPGISFSRRAGRSSLRRRGGI